MLEESRATREFLSVVKVPYSAIIASRLDTSRSSARTAKSAEGVPSQDMRTRGARRQSSNVYPIVVPTNRSAETVRSSIPSIMNKELQVVQLNVGRQATVQESLMNDARMREVSVVAI
jgi:hypothetical protein